MSAEFKLLVVEDDPFSALLMRELLESVGWSCQVATNLEDARETLSKDPPALVLLDVCLQGECARSFDAFTELLKRSQLPVLLVSALSGELLEAVAEKVGARGILTKPFGRRTLARRIRATAIACPLAA